MIFGNRILVIDPLTDSEDTSLAATVCFPVESRTGSLCWTCPLVITGAAVRRLCDSPSAEAYGEGSYTVLKSEYYTALMPGLIRQPEQKKAA